MAWNEELTRSFGCRCSECGEAFVEGDNRKQLGLGCFMHERCYVEVLASMERGTLGNSGEESNSSNRNEEREGFLDGRDDAVRRRAAFKRNRELFGLEAAQRMDRIATWMLKHNNRPKPSA